MNIIKCILLLTSIFVLSGCFISKNGYISSRAKSKLAKSLYQKAHPNHFNILKDDISIGDTIEICEKLEKFCRNKTNFNKYGDPRTDGTKNDNFYCVCLY